MRILLSLLALTIFVPLQAHAYVTPEEMLQDGDFVTPPPNARNAKAARAAQEAEYDARQMEENEDSSTPLGVTDEDGNEGSNNTIDDLHGAAETEDAIDWTATDSGMTEEERRNERVLQRVEENRLNNQGSDGVILHGSAPEPLHGGAPLAPTGMGTVVALLAGAAAIGLTLRMAIKSVLR